MVNSKLIGSKITDARKKINLSQAELARQVSISAQAVGKWERGESLPDITTLNRLAEILGVDLNYFAENFSPVDYGTTSEELLSQHQSDKPLVKKTGWNMSQGNWIHADFSGLKNLQDKFSSSNIKNCRFVASEMAGLTLKANHIESCDFSKSDMSSSNFQASHLVHTLFKCRTLKRIRFIDCRADRMTYEFLKNGKADLTNITLLNDKNQVEHD